MIFCSSLQKKKAFRHLFHHLQYISPINFSISFIVSDCTKNISVFNDKHTHNISALWGHILHQKVAKTLASFLIHNVAHSAKKK